MTEQLIELLICVGSLVLGFIVAIMEEIII